jgi:hypothetical protein
MTEGSLVNMLGCVGERREAGVGDAGAPAPLLTSDF